MFFARQKHYEKARSQRGKKPRFKVGDIVRLQLHKDVFSRGYKPTYSFELYEVMEVLNKMPVTMYMLKNLYDLSYVAGGVYESQITLVTKFQPNQIFEEERLPNGKRRVYANVRGMNEDNKQWFIMN